MTTNYSSNHVKKLINNMETSRSSIAAKKNIPSNLSSLKQTFNQLDSGLKGQSVYIKQLDIASNQPNQQIQKLSQNKRMLLNTIDMVYEEIVQYIDVCKQAFSIGLKDKKDISGWDKVLTDVSRKLEGLKASITPNNIFQTIFKLLNMRDSLFKQFLKGIIYQKHLLWLDLKIPYQAYVHHQVQSILDIVKSSPDKYGYVPTKIQFNPINFNDGRWNSTGGQKNESTIASYLKLAYTDIKQMVETIKNYAKLNDTPESFEDINKNTVIVQGLRQKIEQHSINYNVLLQKYRSMQIKDNEGDIKSKLDQILSQSSKKDSEISLLQSAIISHQNIITNLKDRIKQLEEEVFKLNLNYYPKLKEVEGLQKGLLEEFYKVKKEIDGVSMSLQNDNQLKNRLQNQVKQSKELVNNLVNILGRQRRNIKDLKQQNKKLDMLTLQLTNKHFPA